MVGLVVPCTVITFEQVADERLPSEMTKKTKQLLSGVEEEPIINEGAGGALDEKVAGEPQLADHM